MPLSAPTTAAPQVASQRLLVLMFTDLVNSTAIKEQLGSQAYAQLLNRHDGFIRQALDVARGGRVLQDTGDGYFLSFDSVAQAVSAALVFQWLMAAEAWPVPFASRVGLHLGEVDQHTNAINEQEKFVGSAIDLASRVMSLARGGQILLTRAVFDAARQIVREHPAPAPMTPAPPLQWMAHGPYLFKGAAEPMDVYEVGGEGVAPLAPPPDTEKAKRHIRPGDEETLGWRPALGRSLESTTNWILVEKLGEGGFGEVWLAEQIKTAAKRVFKFCFDPDRLRALKREVVLFRLLKKALGDRRDIAAVKEWQFERPPYFIELDYTPEGNLTQWAERQGGIARVPLADRLRYVAEIARALAAAHSVGILHKDIKPSNILMARDHAGPVYPRLTDFGIGILTDRSRLDQFDISQAGFTASNITMNDSSRTGTRMYTPPEALLDRPHTVQGDVYALGVLLYQMAVGDLSRPLGVGWEREVADELLREDIAACVDVEPARRIASATELAARLDTLDARRAARRTAQAQEAAVRLARRRRTQVRLLAAGLATTAAVAMAIAFFWRDAAKQRGEAVFQQSQAVRQRQAATREADNARRQELSARARLADTFTDAGWADYQRGDGSMALLHFAQALETFPSPANRLRLSYALATGPRLIDHPPVPYEPELQYGMVYLSLSDGAVRPVHAQTKEPLAPAIRETAPIVYVRFSPEGRRIVTGAKDKRVRVWDLGSATPLMPPIVLPDEPTDVSFSPDGKSILTACADGTARIWNAATGEAITPPMKHAKGVRCARFDRSGTRVVTASHDCTARVWDAVTGLPVSKPMPHDQLIYLAAFSPDGLHIVTAGLKVARVWDVNTGEPVTPPIAGDDPNFDVMFSPDGSRIAVASASRRVRIYDAWSGLPVASPLTHNSIVFGAWFADDNAGAGDGGTLYTRCDGVIRRWEADRPLPEITLAHRRQVNHAVFSQDGRRILTAGADRTAAVWDAATGRQLAQIRAGVSVSEAQFSPDQTRILLTTYNGVSVWNAETAQPISPKFAVEVTHASFSPDGRRVLTSGWDKTARVWDAASGEPIGPPLVHGDWVDSAAFSPDGSRIATASKDGHAHLWDAASWKELIPPIPTGSWCRCVAFSPDGRRIATAAINGQARIWDAATGAAVTPPLEHGDSVERVEFDPTGRRVATASVDGTARVWDAATGEPVTPPLTHASKVNWASFSRDGALIVTASEDKTACVWDAATGRRIIPFLPHDNNVLQATFSPRGDRILIASGDPAAHVYPLPPPTMSDPDLKATSELLVAHRFDATGGATALSSAQWAARYNDLATRHADRFFPVPDQKLFDAETNRAPADPGRLQTLGQWFGLRGHYAMAAALLEKARAAGASGIDDVQLAGMYWMGNELSHAAEAYARAINATATPDNDPARTVYLKQCLAAVRRAATQSSPAR